MGGNIFNGNINGRATAWMMIGMLVFAVIWESFTDWLEHKLHHNKAHSEILQKVYKELMILGFIAFGLIMGKEVGAVTWNAETLHCFEFCDLRLCVKIVRIRQRFDAERLGHPLIDMHKIEPDVEVHDQLHHLSEEHQRFILLDGKDVVRCHADFAEHHQRVSLLFISFSLDLNQVGVMQDALLFGVRPLGERIVITQRSFIVLGCCHLRCQRRQETRN
eukprot:COSAG03_NODE_4086_length_1690_cov_1.191075_2_plen_218_part_01